MQSLPETLVDYKKRFLMAWSNFQCHSKYCCTSSTAAMHDGGSKHVERRWSAGSLAAFEVEAETAHFWKVMNGSARSMQWNFRAGSRLARGPNPQVYRGTRLDQDQSLMQIVLHSSSPQTVHKASWLDSGQLCTSECTNAVYLRYQYYRYQVLDSCTKIGNYVCRTERPGCLPNVF